MTRISSSVTKRQRHKKILKRAKGAYAGRSRRYKIAYQTVIRAMAYEFRDRKARKRDFRELWILRIGAACKELGISYNRFMEGLKKAKITLNRKMLAELAVSDKPAFGKLVEAVRP